jgi:phage-related holin
MVRVAQVKLKFNFGQYSISRFLLLLLKLLDRLSDVAANKYAVKRSSSSHGSGCKAPS